MNTETDGKTVNVSILYDVVVFDDAGAHSSLSLEEMTSLPVSTLYWKLPGKFRGNQITAYGGKLKYDVFYRENARGVRNEDPDIIIEVRRWG